MFRWRYSPPPWPGTIGLPANHRRHVQGIAWVMKPYGVGLVALVCGAIVWLASYDRNVFSTGSRYRRVMLYLGSRSYSLYLAHLVVFLTIRDLFRQFGQDSLTLRVRPFILQPSSSWRQSLYPAGRRN